MTAGIRGIDVSYHNGVIDWQKVKQSVDFAIIRAGYGKSQMDKQYINNICGAHTAGLKIGIYWFIYAANMDEAVLNAKMCEKCIEGYKDIITMRVWADWEYDSDKRNPQTKESRTAIVRAFCDYLSSKGYEVGVYSNVDYIENKFGDLSEYPLWLARYYSVPGDYKPFMWQRTSEGKIPGISGKVDMNVYYGNLQGYIRQRNTVRMGMSGSDITYLQQRLTTIGYGAGTVDGIFGMKTLEAVRAFQADYGLIIDGVVGAKTWAALEGKAENTAETAAKEFSLKADGDEYISSNFKVSEFRCKDGSDKILIDVNFVRDKLQAIRDHFGAPVTINSGYRTPEYNKKVGGASKSYHMTGQAFDIVVKGHTPAEVARYAQSLDINGIIQYNNFVHVDSRDIRYWVCG